MVGVADILCPAMCCVVLFVIIGIWGWRLSKLKPPAAVLRVDKGLIDRICPEFICEESGDCTVCLEDVAVGRPCRRLQCGHRFHADCIDSWLIRGSGKSACPTCRQELRDDVAAAVPV